MHVYCIVKKSTLQTPLGLNLTFNSDFNLSEARGYLRSLQGIRLFHIQKHGTYIRWYFINRCARTEKYLLYDLYKAFD